MAKKQKLLTDKEISTAFSKVVKKLQGDGGMRNRAVTKNGQYYFHSQGNIQKTINQLKTVKIKGSTEPLWDGQKLPTRKITKFCNDTLTAAANKYASEEPDRYSEMVRVQDQVLAKALNKAGLKSASGIKIYVLRNYPHIDTSLKKCYDFIIDEMIKLGGVSGARHENKEKLLRSAFTGDQYTQGKYLETIDGNALTKDDFTGTQLGHGEYGDAVIGMQAQAIDAWVEENKDKLGEAGYLQAKTLLIEIESLTNSTFNVTNTSKDNALEIDETATLIVSNQLVAGNTADAQAIENPLAAVIQGLLTGTETAGLRMGHFATIKTKRVILDRIFTLSTKWWNVKKVNTVKDAIEIDKTKSKSSQKQKLKTNFRVLSGFGTAGYMSKIRQAAQKQQHDKLGVSKNQKGTINTDAAKVATIIQDANKLLHGEIQKRMGTPRLNYQTGRFAESAQLENLIQTRQGLEARYTYDLERYGTFEPGGAQGTRSRDPRSIIEQALSRATYFSSEVIPFKYKRMG
tara:strand:- start:442 stop:1986 length:1545 start_codon:yes stop_codon:yes gene_type:complete